MYTHMGVLSSPRQRELCSCHAELISDSGQGSDLRDLGLALIALEMLTDGLDVCIRDVLSEA